MAEAMAECSSIVKDLRALLETSDGADVVMVVGNSELPAHSQILAARSPVFAAMLRNDMKEARSRRIEITDMQEAVLRQMLLFIYTDTAPELGSMAADLLPAADKYDLQFLKEKCGEQMARDLSVENAAAAAALAVLHRCPGLRDAAVQFIARQPEVMASDGWERMLRNNSEAAVEICRLLAAASPRSPPVEASGGSTPATAESTLTPSTRRQPHDAGPPPDDAAVSRMRSLSGEERGRRLREAAQQGAVGELRALLAAGAQVMVRGEDDWTALHHAAVGGHVEAASLLLAAGAQVDGRDRGQQTPLHLAAACGHVAVVRLLLAHSADPNARRCDGWTPLHVVALNGQTEAAAALLGAGADRAARTNGGDTPLDVARQYNRQQLIQMLT